MACRAQIQTTHLCTQSYTDATSLSPSAAPQLARPYDTTRLSPAQYQLQHLQETYSRRETSLEATDINRAHHSIKYKEFRIPESFGYQSKDCVVTTHDRRNTNIMWEARPCPSWLVDLSETYTRVRALLPPTAMLPADQPPTRKPNAVCVFSGKSLFWLFPLS